jgi:hypothetical protein
MKNILTKLVVLLLANTAHAQVSWTEISTPTSKDLKTIHFVSSQVGYVGGDSVLLKTVDGGATWSEMPLDSIPNTGQQEIDILDMEWFDEDHGIIMSGPWGGGSETFDGGVNWDYLLLANSGFCQTSALFFFDEDNGFAGGAGCFEGHIIDRFSGGVWSTTNDPNDWDSQNWVSSIEFKDAMNGLAGTVNGTVLRTTDGGQNWDTIPNLAGDSAVTDFIFYPDGTIRATHQNNVEYGVMISTDGGLTWGFDNDLASFFYPSMNAAHIDENGTTYIAGETFGNDGVIFENSGAFWSMLSVNHPINDITSYGDSITFLVGDSGAIYVNVDLIALSIQEAPQIEFNLVPNPAIDELRIAGVQQQVKSFSVVDMFGRTVLQMNTVTRSEAFINVSELNPGSYFISIQTEVGVGTKRFLKL